jgi:small redox-active disulfide protein 2
MKIKILGTGCLNCQRLEANTKQALAELKLEAEVEKVIEIQNIMSYGIMSTPALVVDGAILLAGTVPSTDELKEKLKNL